jgi:Domain of unknown function (DUF4440)
MKIVIPTIFVVIVLIPMQAVHAQSSTDTVAVITKLENDSVKADLANDIGWGERFLADDWMGCDTEGMCYTKGENLKLMADTKNNRVMSEKLTDLKVRVYGNTAVATYKDTYDAVVRGQRRSHSVVGTDVWVKIGSGWREVNTQWTAIK